MKPGARKAETDASSAAKVRKGGEGKGSVVAKGGTKKEKNLYALLLTLAKLVLTGARQLASLDNVTYDTYFADEVAENSLGRICVAAGAEYD
eukprot:145524-Pyramimonas_sp.AAC.1